MQKNELNKKSIPWPTSTRKKVAHCQGVFWDGQNFSLMGVEIDISRGLFAFNIVGLADKIIREAKLRIVAGIKNAGFETPQRRGEKITINLTPVQYTKIAVYPDLAMAYTYLKATGQIPNKGEGTDNPVCLGEIHLEGNIVCEQDITHIIYASIKNGSTVFIVPRGSVNKLELSEDKEIVIMEIERLSDLRNSQFIPLQQKVHAVHGKSLHQTIHKHLPDYILKDEKGVYTQESKRFLIDQIQGMELQKRLLTIAVAGNHHILFIGQPGSGKTTLAEAGIELLDELSYDEAIEVQGIYHFMKDTTRDTGQFYTRPSRIPHHQISLSSLLFGDIYRMSEVQLAHHGALILHEFYEFKKEVIEGLRELLDDGFLRIRKKQFTIQRRIDQLIIATTNICPCGNRLPRSESPLCTCTISAIKRYEQKVSKAILDRFPLQAVCAYSDHIRIPASNITSFSGLSLKRAVAQARVIQRNRNPDKVYNHMLRRAEIAALGVGARAEELIKEFEDKYALSKRKVLYCYRIARTITDLRGGEKIEEADVLESIRYIKSSILG